MGQFVLMVLVLGVLFLLLGKNFKVFKEAKEIGTELAGLKKELQTEKIRKDNFLSKLSEAENKESLEKMAREDFNLKKIGEKVVAFPVVEKRESSDVAPTSSEENFWQKFFKNLGIK